MFKRPIILVIAAALTLAARPGAAAHKRGPRPGDDAIVILKAGIKSADFVARGMAYEGLAFARHDKAIRQVLKDGTDDPQWVVRAGIARAYIRMRDKGWRAVVRDALFRPTLKPREVLPVLARVGAKQAVAVLIEILGDKEHERQDAVADGIVRVDPPYLAALVNAAARSRDPLVRAAGVRIARQLDLYVHAGHLVAIAKKSGKDPEIVKALLEIAERAPSEDGTAFLKYLRPKDAALRDRVTLARARHGDKSVGRDVLRIAAARRGAERVKALHVYRGIAERARSKEVAALLGDSPDGALVLAVYEILALLGDRTMASQAKALAMGTNVDLRPAGVYYLGRIGGAGRLREMHGYLSDGIRDVRIAAARVIRYIASPVSVGPLRDGLDAEKDAQVRLELLKALAAIKHKTAYEALTFYTRERDDEMRRLVVRALADSGEKTARRGLQTALRDRSPAVRFEAVRGFILSDPANAVKVFKRALNWLPEGALLRLTREFGDPMRSYVELALATRRYEIRDEALRALELLPKYQVPLLSRVLHGSDDTDLRIRVLRALFRIQGRKAATEIKSAALSSSVNYRVVAIRLLGKLGRDKEARELLVKLMSVPNQRVRIAAALTLLGG